MIIKPRLHNKKQPAVAMESMPNLLVTVSTAEGMSEVFRRSEFVCTKSGSGGNGSGNGGAVCAQLSKMDEFALSEIVVKTFKQTRGASVVLVRLPGSGDMAIMKTVRFNLGFASAVDRTYDIKVLKDLALSTTSINYLRVARGLELHWPQTYGSFDCQNKRWSRRHSVDMELPGTTCRMSAKENEEGTTLVQEFVKNSVTLHEFMQNRDKHPIDVLYMLWAMVGLNLQIAMETVGFYHTDMHAENVLVRDLGEVREIRIGYLDLDYVFKTRYVPVIIDYDLSIAKLPYSNTVLMGTDDPRGKVYGVWQVPSLDFMLMYLLCLADLQHWTGSVFADAQKIVERYSVMLEEAKKKKTKRQQKKAITAAMKWATSAGMVDADAILERHDREMSQIREEHTKVVVQPHKKDYRNVVVKYCMGGVYDSDIMNKIRHRVTMGEKLLGTVPVEFVVRIVENYGGDGTPFWTEPRAGAGAGVPEAPKSTKEFWGFGVVKDALERITYELEDNPDYFRACLREVPRMVPKKYTKYGKVYPDPSDSVFSASDMWDDYALARMLSEDVLTFGEDAVVDGRNYELLLDAVRDIGHAEHIGAFKKITGAKASQYRTGYFSEGIDVV